MHVNLMVKDKYIYRGGIHFIETKEEVYRYHTQLHHNRTRGNAGFPLLPCLAVVHHRVIMLTSFLAAAHLKLLCLHNA